MQPPETINFNDPYGPYNRVDFIAIFRPKLYSKEWEKNGEEYTAWQPIDYMKVAQRIGTLVSYDENSFFQLNNNVTRAVYAVKGYRRQIAVWFDNATGKRIA